jgi:hypothetical protein
MLICTCGATFKTTSIGDAVISGGYLYSCDTKECPDCSKRIIDRAGTPICSTEEKERADRIIDSLDARGKQVYGKLTAN